MSRRCAVLGDPVEHSLSPVLHRAGYAALGMDWSYEAVQMTEAGLGEFVAGLEPTWRGLSVTMPLKRAALALPGPTTPRADLAGAANTVLLEDGVVVLVDNTDLPGAAAAIRERYAGPVTAGTVLGGGATAASLGLALCELGAAEVTVLVRSPERAAATVAAVAAHPGRPRVRIGALASDPVVGEVVASTIPATAQDPALLARCAAAAVVLEARYDPWPTPLAQASQHRPLVSGLDLLAHQAALQFALFTGHDIGVDVLRDAGAAVLASRSDQP